MDFESENTDVFNESELEELKQLTIQHRRGQMSDLDFEEQAAWLLKGRGFPILTSMPDLQDTDFTSRPSQVFKRSELTALTSCGERSQRARRSHFRRQKEMRQESLVMKAIKEDEKSQPPKVKKDLADSLILEERVLTSSVANRISSMKNSLVPQIEEIKLKPLVLTLIAAVTITTALIIFIFTRQKATPPVSINELTPLLIAHDQNPELPMLFGPVSVSQCNTLCNAKNGKNCESACRRLSFELFPHRISLKDSSPESLANELSDNCIKAFKAGRKSNTGQVEIKAINYTSLENLSLSELMQEYTAISNEHGKLEQGAKDNKTIQNSSESLCIRANEIISYIGAIVANSYKDHYSIAYYQLTQRALSNKNALLQAKLSNTTNN